MDPVQYLWSETLNRSTLGPFYSFADYVSSSSSVLKSSSGPKNVLQTSGLGAAHFSNGWSSAQEVGSMRDTDLSLESSVVNGLGPEHKSRSLGNN